MFTEAIYKPPGVSSVDWIGKLTSFPRWESDKQGQCKGETCLPDQVLAWRSPLVHLKLWGHLKWKTPKEINVPICDRLIPGPFLERLNLPLKALRSHIWSYAQTDFRGFPCYQNVIWATIDDLLKHMPPFPVIFTPLFSQIEPSMGTAGHKSLPPLPPALSLTYRPPLSLVLLTW